MHQDNTAQAEQKKDEREKVLKEIRQLENRQKILQNKQRNEERKARTRRLHARYVLGMKIKDIAAMEGVHPSRIGHSIQGAIQSLRRYFERRKWTGSL